MNKLLLLAGLSSTLIAGDNITTHTLNTSGNITAYATNTLPKEPTQFLTFGNEHSTTFLFGTNNIRLTLKTNVDVSWYNFPTMFTNKTVQVGQSVTNRMLEIIFEGKTNFLIINVIGMSEGVTTNRIITK